MAVIRQLNGIVFDVVQEEEHLDETTITEHPVEQGSAITDHVFILPAMLTLRVASSLSSFVAGGDPFFLKDLYQRLLLMKAQRAPFEVETGKRSYANMLIKSLSVRTDEHTENVLALTIRCKEAIITSTQTATFPATDNQATPEKTASPQNKGFQSLVSRPLPFD